MLEKIPVKRRILLKLLVMVMMVIHPGIVLATLDGQSNAYFPDKVGIKTKSPTAVLHVNGNIRIKDGSQASGRLFLSDSGGNGNWTAAGSVAGITVTPSGPVGAVQISGGSVLSSNGNRLFWTQGSNILTVNGSLIYKDGNQSNSYVLKSNASGQATWVDPSSLGLTDEWTKVGNYLHPKNNGGNKNLTIGSNVYSSGDVVLGKNGDAIFNNQKNSVNFVLRGRTNPNLLVSNGANNRVGINLSSPKTVLGVEGALTMRQIIPSPPYLKGAEENGTCVGQSAQTISVTSPGGGPAVGDLLLAVILSQTNDPRLDLPNCSVPWILSDYFTSTSTNPSFSSDISVAVYYRYVTLADVNSNKYDFAFPSTTSFSVSLFRYSRVNQNKPVQVIGRYSRVSVSQCLGNDAYYSPTVNTKYRNSNLLIGSFFVTNGLSNFCIQPDPPTNPSGFVEVIPNTNPCMQDIQRGISPVLYHSFFEKSYGSIGTTESYSHVFGLAFQKVNFIGFSILLNPISSEPADPDQNSIVIWMENAINSIGEMGDILVKISSQGITKGFKLLDSSGNLTILNKLIFGILDTKANRQESILNSQSLLRMKGLSNAAHRVGNPNIDYGKDGQIIILRSIVTNTTFIPLEKDIPLNPGTGLDIRGDFNMSYGDSIMFYYDAGDNMWIELSRVDVPPLSPFY